jgi:hypothetical protein
LTSAVIGLALLVVGVAIVIFGNGSRTKLSVTGLSERMRAITGLALLVIGAAGGVGCEKFANGRTRGSGVLVSATTG